MEWQLFIFTQLNLNDLTPKVISDFTGVLSSRSFLSFLDEKGITYLVTGKTSEIISAANSSKNLIITTQKDVPAFIKKTFTHKQFSYSELPLNGDISSLLKHKENDEIVSLLDFVFSKDPHRVITKHNIEELTKKSVFFSYHKELEETINIVHSLIRCEPEVESVLNLGKLWGRVIYLSNKVNSLEYFKSIAAVDSFSKSFFFAGKMEQVFYASTSKNPKSVDRILSNIKSIKDNKFAIVCFDCMGYAEWSLLQAFLQPYGFSFFDMPLFAMLPSITKYSRTAIFRGSKDVYNIPSPGRLDEAKSFASFFSDRQTKYFIDGDIIDSDTLTGYNSISILYSFFDELSHSTQFPPNETSKSLYFKAIHAYLEKISIVQTLKTLQANNFAIYFCSDHGSVVASGNGQKLEKYLVDNFAKRAAIVPKASAELVKTEMLNVPFQSDISVALPEGRTMFANKNQIEINHGGITVEEMVVPYIKVQ